MNLDTALYTLFLVSKLPKNWDSYNADLPNPEVVGVAKQLLTTLAKDDSVPTPYINSTRTGGIQLDWEQNDKYFEVELCADKLERASFLFRDDRELREEEGHFHIVDELDTLTEYIRRVYK